jgi:cysteine desulfurase/selenocysteine lyase
MHNSEFELEDGLSYLNHAAVAPWPKRTALAVAAFAQQNVTRGATDYPHWMETEQDLREKLQWLINAPSVNDIALLKNTSEALSVVAYGIDWQAGDNVVFAQQEFPSNRVVWESLAQFGVEVRRVDIYSTDTPEQALIEAMDSNTRLLSTSSVHYADGLQMRLQELSQACKKQAALFCVDAIQSIGAMPFDVQAIGADFVMADGHKWMLGPEGLAVFYCRAELREQLKLSQYGWHMLADSSDYNSLEWQVCDTAKRFECGSPNMLACYALNSSLSLLQEVGMSAVWRAIQDNVNYLRTEIGKIAGVQIHSPADRPSGMLNFSIDGVHSKALQQALMQNNVICAQRGQGVRFSPHFYTDKQCLDRAVALTVQLAQQLIT